MAEIKNVFTDSTNIIKEIKKEIVRAKYCIYICVSWINADIFKKELNSAVKRGVEVEIITDTSNESKFNVLDKKIKITKLGFKLSSKTKFHLHNKFAIIDGSTLILGSYNWSFLGSRHLENVSIISLDGGEGEDVFNNTIEEYVRQFKKLSIMDNNILKMQYRCDTSKTLVINLEEETTYIIDFEDLEQYYTSSEEKYLDKSQFVPFDKYFDVGYDEHENRKILFNDNIYKDVFAAYIWCEYIIVSPRGDGGKGFKKLYSNIFQDFKAPSILMLPPF